MLNSFGEFAKDARFGLATRESAKAAAATLTGSTLRSRSVAEKAMIADAVRRNVWPLIAAGRVRPPIYTTFPLDRACEAHRLMESSQHIGKIVLTI